MLKKWNYEGVNLDDLASEFSTEKTNYLVLNCDGINTFSLSFLVC